MKVTFEQVKTFAIAKRKHERLYGRNASTGWSDDYGDLIVQNHLNDLNGGLGGGYSIISRHDSIDGQLIKFTADDVLMFNNELE